jgi:hypothetical protein
MFEIVQAMSHFTMTRESLSWVTKTLCTENQANAFGLDSRYQGILELEINIGPRPYVCSLKTGIQPSSPE